MPPSALLLATIFAGAADDLSVLETQADIGAVFTAGLYLDLPSQRVSRDMPRLLKSCFSRDRLNLAVVELALRVDVQPASGVVVLVALDFAGLALPLVV